MITAAVLVDLRSAAEVPRDDEQNLVAQSASGHVFQKRRDRLIDRPAEHLHAGDDARIVAVRVHVPARRMHRHELAARLDQPPSGQHVLAEQRRAKQFLADLDAAGFVPLDQTAILLRQIERFRRTSQDHVERLLRESVGTVEHL